MSSDLHVLQAASATRDLFTRMTHDQALAKVMQHRLKGHTQVYKQYAENESFKRFVGDMVYAITNS